MAQVLSEQPVCVQILLRPFSAALKAIQRELNCSCILPAHGSKESFFFGTGDGAGRPGMCTMGLGTGQKVRWLIKHYCLNDDSSIIEGCPLMTPGASSVSGISHS